MVDLYILYLDYTRLLDVYYCLDYTRQVDVHVVLVYNRYVPYRVCVCGHLIYHLGLSNKLGMS